MTDAPEIETETIQAPILVDHMPQIGESLADFQARMAGLAAGPRAPWVPPTREQAKAAIKDATTPAPVREFLREQLYGNGGNGRRGARKDRLMTQSVAPGLRTASAYRRPEGVSGRQRKRGRRLLRAASKALQTPR